MNIFAAIFLEIEGQKSEKIRQNFAAIFADLLPKIRKNFALGDCGHKGIAAMGNTIRGNRTESL